MVAKDISDKAEDSSASLRRPLLTFGIGVAVLGSLVGALLMGSSFLAPGREHAAGVTIALALHAAVESESAAQQFSLIEPRSPGGQLAADPALVEDSPFGPLPIIAVDGRSPMTAYARPFEAKDKRPRIAIVIGGLNVSVTNTKLALARLPGPITLAFAPFGSDAQTQVDAAREAGHEVLLEVPMEPLDFPESDPGAHALMVAASSDENIRRLDWSLSRFTGYVGLTNLLGSRFMSDEAAFEPMVRETARRGLMFFDNGKNRGSLAPMVMRRTGGSIAAGTLVLDDAQSREGVDKKLAELEAEARRSGSAIGVGSAFPVTIARVAAWADSANSRGFMLVPVSALASKPEPATQAAPVAQPKSAPAKAVPPAEHSAPLPPPAPALRASAEPTPSHTSAHH